MQKLTIYNFRHTFASLALQSGSDVGAVSGHSSIRITMEIYHHLNPQHARKVIENLPCDFVKTKGSIMQMELISIFSFREWMLPFLFLLLRFVRV